MSSYLCFQIELTRGYDYSAFREDLKKLYNSAGVQGKNTVFLFTDTQVDNRLFVIIDLIYLIQAHQVLGILRSKTMSRKKSWQSQPSHETSLASPFNLCLQIQPMVASLKENAITVVTVLFHNISLTFVFLPCRSLLKNFLKTSITFWTPARYKLLNYYWHWSKSRWF